MSYFWNKAKFCIFICVVELVFAEHVMSETPESTNPLEELAKKFETWALRFDTDELKERPFIKDLRENLNKAVDKVKSQLPSDIGSMQDYADEAKKGAEEILEQFKSMTLSDEAKQMKDYSTKLYEDAKNTFSDFRKKFE